MWGYLFEQQVVTVSSRHCLHTSIPGLGPHLEKGSQQRELLEETWYKLLASTGTWTQVYSYLLDLHTMFDYMCVYVYMCVC